MGAGRRGARGPPLTLAKLWAYAHELERAPLTVLPPCPHFLVATSQYQRRDGAVRNACCMHGAAPHKRPFCLRIVPVSMYLRALHPGRPSCRCARPLCRCLRLPLHRACRLGLCIPLLLHRTAPCAIARRGKCGDRGGCSTLTRGEAVLCWGWVLLRVWSASVGMGDGRGGVRACSLPQLGCSQAVVDAMCMDLPCPPACA